MQKNIIKFYLIITFNILIFINLTYSEIYEKKQEQRYKDLAIDIFSIYYSFYNKIIPFANGKIYNYDKGLIVTTYVTKDSRYFGSEKNNIIGNFALEINISNDILYKENKYVYYYVDMIIDNQNNEDNKKYYDLSKGKVITAKAGCNPLIVKGELPDLGVENNYVSIYIFCY